MEVLDIVPRDIFVNIEFSSQEIRHILDFLEKSILLYVKVHSDGSAEQSGRVAEQFISELKSIMKAIEDGEKK